VPEDTVFVDTSNYYPGLDGHIEAVVDGRSRARGARSSWDARSTHLGNGYGSQGSALRAPGLDPANYTSFDAWVRYAQAAERGKVAFLFLPDFLGE
jgi:hypothetical protein